MLLFKNLLRRKVRTALSLLGIAIGIAAIIAFNAIADGFKASLGRFAESTGAQLMVMEKGLPEPRDSRIAGKDVEAIRKIRGVEHVASGAFLPLRPKGASVSSGLPAVFAIGRNHEERAIRRYKNDKLKGALPRTDDEIMLGYIAAEKLHKKVGDTIELWPGAPYQVTGIYEVGLHWENVGCVMSVRRIQRKLGVKDGVMMLFVYVSDAKAIAPVQEEIQKRFPRLKAIRTEEFGANFEQLEYVDWFVWVISLVSVLVGGLGILNTMLMSVSERTREIGTLRAVGWSCGRVLRLILAEGTMISLLGGVVGIVAGYAGAELILLWAPKGFLGTSYTPLLFAQAMAIALGLGFFGALYPAFRASQLSPIEALRYE